LNHLDHTTLHGRLRIWSAAYQRRIPKDSRHRVRKCSYSTSAIAGSRPPAAGGCTMKPFPERVPSRVVIEAVAPEIDAGRFAVKRTVGEAITVAPFSRMIF
jgi:hypothetical protein